MKVAINAKPAMKVSLMVLDFFIIDFNKNKY